MSHGPRRRSNAAAPEAGLNYAAIGASMSGEVVAFPPEGFRAAEYRHRIGSGAQRFDVAGRALMTWGALRQAGFRVEAVQAEAPTGRNQAPMFLDDGTPWITPGMTATVTAAEGGISGPVKVLTVIDEPGRIGYTYGSMLGHSTAGERLLLLEHDTDDSVWVTLRSIWQAPASRWRLAARADDKQHRSLDERIVRALHPSFAAQVIVPPGAVLGDAAVPGVARLLRRTVVGTSAQLEQLGDAVLGWRVQRRSGIAVRLPDGRDAGPAEVGLEAVVIVPLLGPVRIAAPVRVTAVLREPDRIGFVYRALPGHPEVGEEAFLVRREGREAVFELRALSRPSFPSSLLPPVAAAFQSRYTARYLRSLLP